MTRPRDVEQQALERFVRARAPDFSAEERRELDAWLTDETHRMEFERVQKTWTMLDGLAGAVDSLRVRPGRWGSGWSRAADGLVLAGIATALFLAVRPVEPPPQRFETAAAEQREVRLGDGTTISLNAESAIDLVDGKAPRVELLRGDVFVDVHHRDGAGLEVRVGRATIRDIGTRFSVAMAGTGGSVAVADGLVELRADNGYLVVRAGHRARFDDQGPMQEEPVATTDVAPWRERRWRFATTPLSELAAEMARQQRIRVDIADPAVAALTVSGSFGFGEPERVLWAAAQVHGLTLTREGERHFSLERGLQPP